MVISGGFNVYPTEVEAVLCQHPAVDEACVFGVPDDKWGEAVRRARGAARRRHAPTQAELIDFCAERLGGFKRPRRVEFVAALPQERQRQGRRARTCASPYWPAASGASTEGTTRMNRSDPVPPRPARSKARPRPRANSSTGVDAFIARRAAAARREHGITHERGADRALLEQVWRARASSASTA